MCHKYHDKHTSKQCNLDRWTCVSKLEGTPTRRQPVRCLYTPHRRMLFYEGRRGLQTRLICILKACEGWVFAGVNGVVCVWLCLINPRVRKITNETSSCPAGDFLQLFACTMAGYLPDYPFPICLRLRFSTRFNLIFSFFLFLSLFSKTQPDHWTKRMASTRLVA